ncbi:hypothetical protein B0H17DRAFT_1202290 [Mycena rosella]|uniref:Uncharacterized protein n=1 Tax=Mycena rosella TaxID=1033263 RepID=A0AAD7GDD6_MYCRO|nr:hypothetical protein B0H17DRAFT_1202290 [Mycena rosella]
MSAASASVLVTSPVYATLYATPRRARPPVSPVRILAPSLYQYPAHIPPPPTLYPYDHEFVLWRSSGELGLLERVRVTVRAFFRWNTHSGLD